MRPQDAKTSGLVSPLGNLNVFSMSAGWCWWILLWNKDHLLALAQSVTHTHTHVFGQHVTCWSTMTSAQLRIRVQHIHAPLTHSLLSDCSLPACTSVSVSVMMSWVIIPLMNRTVSTRPLSSTRHVCVRVWHSRCLFLSWAFLSDTITFDWLRCCCCRRRRHNTIAAESVFVVKHWILLATVASSGFPQKWTNLQLAAV